MSSISVGREFYPARSFSIPQLLYATKRKIQTITSDGRVATTMTRVEVDALEENALEVLGLIRSMKNTFALVNRMPLDVFSLIPEYWDRHERDKETIKLTHVCHNWRELFTSRPSLWNRLDCVDVDKTCAYLERSKSSPLEISLKGGNTPDRTDALRLVGPHVDRIKSLAAIGAWEDVLSDIVPYFSCPVPLLEHLSIVIRAPNFSTLDRALFNGDLSSVRTLELEGVVTGLPWRNLSNLTSFSLSRMAADKITITILLDFFEHAPMLRRVTLAGSIPLTSNALPERVVSLPRLEEFVFSLILLKSTWAYVENRNSYNCTDRAEATS